MESQLPVNDSPQPEETVGAVLLKTLRELLPRWWDGERREP